MAFLMPGDDVQSPSPKSSEEFADMLESRAQVLHELQLFPTAMYTVSKTLKTTLQGAVKVAKHAKTGEEYALKESNIQLATRRSSISGKRVMENVFKEYKILRLLQDAPHENVIGLHEAFTDDKRIFMVLEYCSGGELYDQVEERGSFPENKLKEVFLQIARGLKHLHDHGICHLDLSLENVFLTKDGVSKIGDFGVAREFKDGDDLYHSTFLDRPGKISYMAPEVLGYKDYHGRSADVFSLGVMLFTMAFGFPPFEMASMEDVRFRLVMSKSLTHLLKEWKLENKVSKDLISLMSKILTVEKDRLSLDQVLEHPWLAN